MLAEHVARICRDILEEYAEYELLSRLQRAAKLLESAASNPALYDESRRGALLTGLAELATKSALLTYPMPIRMTVVDDRLAPAAIAQQLIVGLPRRLDDAASSAEFKALFKRAAGYEQLLTTTRDGLLRLGVQPGEAPPDDVVLSILIPIEAMDGDLRTLSDRIEPWGELFAQSLEWTTGEAQPVRFFGASTSILQILVAMPEVAAAFVMGHYAELLECAVKIMNILKAYRELRSQGVEAPPDHNAFMANMVEKAVEAHLAANPSDLPELRQNELRTAFRKTAVKLNAELQKGVRFSVSIESAEKFASVETNAATLQAVKREERQLDQLAQGIEPGLLEGPKAEEPADLEQRRGE